MEIWAVLLKYSFNDLGRNVLHYMIFSILALASTEQTTFGSDTTEVPSYSIEPSITSNNATIKSPQIKHNVKGSSKFSRKYTNIT